MSWREQYLPASFRAVPFFVETSDTAGGRKTVVHEYPFRDQAFAEDLGQRADTFRIDGYVLGPDYFPQRDALVAALKTAGPGELVHPYLGRKTVSIVGPYGLRETKDEGGMARFSMEFIETASAAFIPDAGIDASGRASTSADAALVSVQRSFRRQYSPMLPTGRTAPASAFTGVLSTLTNLNARLRSTLNPLLTGTQAVATFHAQLDAIIHGATSLVYTPVNLAAQLGSAFDSLLTGIRLPRLGIGAMLHIYDFPSVVAAAYPSSSGITSARGYVNTAAVDTFVRRLAIIGGTRLSVGATKVDATQGGYDSYDDAIAVRAALLDRLDADELLVLSTIDSAGAVVRENDDDAFGALMQLRADIARAVPGAANDLPRLLTVTPPVSVPALVLAYQLYGSVDLADDLVARNDVRRPGFVPGSVPLRVLSHA